MMPAISYVDMPCGSNGHMCDHPQCKCIDSGKLCNGESDCTNSSDEATCDSDLKGSKNISALLWEILLNFIE